jgi:exosome complex component RRP45
MVKASSREDAQPMTESSNAEVNTSSAVAAGESESHEIGSPKSLKDAIKPKHKRKKKKSDRS